MGSRTFGAAYATRDYEAGAEVVLQKGLPLNGTCVYNRANKDGSIDPYGRLCVKVFTDRR